MSNPNDATRPVTINIPAPLHERLTQLAKSRGSTVEELATELCVTPLADQIFELSAPPLSDTECPNSVN